MKARHIVALTAAIGIGAAAVFWKPWQDEPQQEPYDRSQFAAREKQQQDSVAVYREIARRATDQANRYEAKYDSLQNVRNITIKKKYETVRTKPVPLADSLAGYFANYRSPVNR